MSGRGAELSQEKVKLRKAEVRWTRPAARRIPITSEEADTEVRWTRFATRRIPIASEEAETEVLLRKFRAILNKLTPQKFQSLVEQALKLEISTEDRLSGCIDMIFSRAIKEPHFSLAYANLCKVMSPIKVEVAVEDGKTKSTNFRRMLLTKCQEQFEKDIQDDKTLEEMRDRITQAETDEKRQELKEELSIAVTRMRKRSLGNIRFIGELFKLKMLSATIMHECITRLLRSTSDQESLECFRELIMTVGKDLDKPEAKTRMDAYLKRVDNIIKKGRIPTRIKLLLKDVPELRENNWTPRPRQVRILKTIDQIRAEAKREEEKEKAMIQGGRCGSDTDVDRGREKVDTRERRDNREREREMVDHTKLFSMLSKRKEKSTVTPSVGANIRPSGWKHHRPYTSRDHRVQQTHSHGWKKAAVGCGPGNKAGPKHLTEEEEVLSREAASQFFANTPSKDTPAHTVQRQDSQEGKPAPVDEAMVSYQGAETEPAYLESI